MQASWNAFKTLKLKPTTDFFSFLTDESVVEIYNAVGIQVFRNCKFFEICSYTLEDLYCRPWFELYERDPQVISAITKQVELALSGKTKTLFFPELGIHGLNEKNSPFKYRLELEIDCIAPIIDEMGRFSSFFAAIETVKILNKLTNTEKELRLADYYSKNINLSM